MRVSFVRPLTCPTWDEMAGTFAGKFDAGKLDGSDAETAHVQASFFTEEERYAVPETPFSIPVTVTREELTTLINQLLEVHTNEGVESSNKQFDFLINGELIRSTLAAHISQRNIPVENVIQIEYVERNPPPSLSKVFDHKDWVSSVHCSSKFIVTGCYDNNIRIWNYDGQLLCTAEGHSAPIKDVCWISTGDSMEECLFLSASQDQNVHIWRFSPANLVVTLLHQCKGHARSVEAAAVSPDRSKFCSVSWDNFLKVWSAAADPSPAEEAEEDSELPSKKRKPHAPKHRPTTRTPLVTLSGHTQPVSTVVWPSDWEDGVITAGWDHCIRLWDVTSGINTATLTGSKVFHSIDWSCLSGLVASANSDKLIRIWDTRQAETSMVQSTLTSHQGWVVAVHWSPDSEHQLLSGSYDSTLRLWDTRNTKLPLFTIAAHEGKALCVDWTLPKVLASGGTDSKLRTYTL